MTETRIEYTPSLGADIEGNDSPDYHDPELPDLRAIERRAKGLSRYGRWQRVRQDLDALLTEVRRLRVESEVWERHGTNRPLDGLVQIVAERDSLRALLGQEQRARWAAEQDAQHWQEKAEQLEAELDTVRYAAHMPASYEYGLPAWINIELYGKLLLWTDNDGRPIRRSEDIREIMHLKAEVQRLQTQVSQLAEAVEMATGIA